MNRYDGTPNRLERLLIRAPFWLRVLLVACGIATLGLLLGAIDGLVDVFYTS